jgi:predicted P-loop ATPase
MEITLDLEFDLATAYVGNSKKWKNRVYTWKKFVDKLKDPFHTNETIQEFFNMTKDEQGQVKDVGAYFGGYIRSGRRLKANIIHRQLLTLDIDFADLEFVDTLYEMYPWLTFVVHGTHKHQDSSPRLRLLVPLDREVPPDEYTAISRMFANTLNIELFDSTTFDTNRFMFWQSSPCDVEYYFQANDGQPLSADSVLDMYVDWTDLSSHPRHAKELSEERTFAEKAENPLEKKGAIGLFCRTYTIHEAIEHYLADAYEQSDFSSDRYTYTGGTTSSGAIVYNDVFMFSHHSTDPVSGRLVNAYDLVRMHKFEGLSESDSERRMFDLIMNDPEVKRTLALEKIEGSADFDDLDEDEQQIAKGEANWMVDLESDKQGNYLPTDRNIAKIFANDRMLKERFAWNEFARKPYKRGALPWDKRETDRPIEDIDFSGLRTYIGQVYGISSPLKIDDAFKMEQIRHKFHPVREYLLSVQWDGTERYSELFPYWLGADRNEYTIAVAKKMLIGAVKRIFENGCKFDEVVTFVGEQGVGKSTFAQKLGKVWFSDSLHTVKGNSAFEALQGKWIIEMAELSGLKKADLDAQKHYMSKCEDTFRKAYGHVPEDYPRQNIFIATTNDWEFILDMTGGRRFLPIATDTMFQINHPANMPSDYVDQIWAEAYQMYLVTDFVDVPFAKEQQEIFLEVDPRINQIEDFLDIEIPTNFYDLTIEQRLTYFTYVDQDAATNTMLRTRVSAVEVFVECFGKNRSDMNRTDARAIKAMIKHLGWNIVSQPYKLNYYGTVRGYERPTNNIKRQFTRGRKES